MYFVFVLVFYIKKIKINQCVQNVLFIIVIYSWGKLLDCIYSGSKKTVKLYINTPFMKNYHNLALELHFFLIYPLKSTERVVNGLGTSNGFIATGAVAH